MRLAVPWNNNMLTRPRGSLTSGSLHKNRKREKTKRDKMREGKGLLPIPSLLNVDEIQLTVTPPSAGANNTRVGRKLLDYSRDDSN